MLGTIRFFLAIVVALGHANVRIAGLNPGVMSVVFFYLISGYVMTSLIRTHYLSLARVPHFYLDRSLRIFPQYLLIATLTLACYFLVHPDSYFLSRVPQLRDYLNNFAVLPLNYYMFNGSDKFTLIPPAWSLSAELQFYLLVPLLLIFRMRSLAFVIGLAVFAVAAADRINSEYYGYRLLPGVLMFFLLGSLLYDWREQKRGLMLVIGVIAAVIGGAFLLHLGGFLGLPYNRETLLGLLIGLPLLYVFGRLPQQALDNRLGDLSYGIFLNHFLIQWTVTGVPDSASGWALYLGASIALSALTQWLVERPVLAWKRRLRVAGQAPTAASLSPARSRLAAVKPASRVKKGV